MEIDKKLKIFFQVMKLDKNNERLLPFYKFATEHVSVGIHAVDLNGKTIIYNDKMKEIEGFIYRFSRSFYNGTFST